MQRYKTLALHDDVLISQKLESELLLVTRQNDNHTPGPGPGKLVARSHQRSELSISILCTFSRGDDRIWKFVPIPNCLGRKPILMNFSISNGDLTCRRMMIPAAPNGGIRSSVGILALPFRPLYNNISQLMTHFVPTFQGVFKNSLIIPNLRLSHDRNELFYAVYPFSKKIYS